MCSLAQFNQQVLECQDDAFTLAWYLLGDEAAAEAAVQAAVMRAYHRAQSGRVDDRRLILKQVLRCCAVKIGNDSSGMPSGYLEVHKLPAVERQVIILIDILCLNYDETAHLSNRSIRTITQRLAQARRKESQANLTGRREIK